MANTERRQHLEELRRGVLGTLSTHLGASHAEEWAKLVTKADRNNGYYNAIYRDDIPNCVECRAYSASIQVIDDLIDELGEDGQEEGL